MYSIVADVALIGFLERGGTLWINQMRNLIVPASNSHKSLQLILHFLLPPISYTGPVWYKICPFHISSTQLVDEPYPWPLFTALIRTLFARWFFCHPYWVHSFHDEPDDETHSLPCCILIKLLFLVISVWIAYIIIIRLLLCILT